MAGYHSVFQAIGSYSPQHKIFTGADFSVNQTSTVCTTTGGMPTASCTVWVETGTPSGTFYVDVTNDLRGSDPQTYANAQWVTVDSIVYTSGVDPNSNTSSQIVWVNGSKFARVRWVNSGGSGTGGAMLTGVGN